MHGMATLGQPLSGGWSWPDPCLLGAPSVMERGATPIPVILWESWPFGSLRQSRVEGNLAGVKGQVLKGLGNWREKNMSQVTKLPGDPQANCSGSGLGGHTISGTRRRASTEQGGLEGAGVFWFFPPCPVRSTFPMSLSHFSRSTRHSHLPLQLGLMSWWFPHFFLCVRGEKAPFQVANGKDTC